VNQYTKKEKLNLNNIQLELHATERPSNGMHPRRFHSPNAPEVALLSWRMYEGQGAQCAARSLQDRRRALGQASLSEWWEAGWRPEKIQRIHT